MMERLTTTHKNSCIYSVSFTGKERDDETGYSYFGARYYDSDLSGLFLSVDPLADKYPSISPYAYCAWNPLKLVDPDGREIGDYYDKNGNYLGWDGINDNHVYIIGNNSDIQKIRRNNKDGGITDINDLKSKPLLETTYGVLRGSCEVLERAERNSKQTREECSVVDYSSGLGKCGRTGESQSVEMPKPPEWVLNPISIHSHNKNNDASQMSTNHKDNSGDADHFGKYAQNIIVGPLGVGGKPGLCFYRRTSVKEDPIYQMPLYVAEKIISQQHIRTQNEIHNIIKKL